MAYQQHQQVPHQNARISTKEFAAKFQTKREVYNFLT
jgi:hypothetical protein